MKRLARVIAFILVFIAGFWLAQKFSFPWLDRNVAEDSAVVLDRIKDVTKLIAVEGYFSEIYDYKDYYGYDWSIFRKKALIRIKAKVSMGFDLENMDIRTIPEKRTIQISRLPQAKILSIDHQLDYYDISEGTFNSFTTEDLNDLNEKAKNFIVEVALQSDLVQEADKKGDELMETLAFLVEGAGWHFELSSLKSPEFHN
ncbi:MAG: DUF4230 domain-containing protein [Saprospiraceae bacterium]|nr:DUF4230 domain-containing protein [Saprospiraceae bacterium]